MSTTFTGKEFPTSTRLGTPGLALDVIGNTRSKLFDSAIVGNGQEAVDFITNILESSTR